MRFTQKTIPFLKKAHRQKSPAWLDKNRADYETHIVQPLKGLAAHLKTALAQKAAGYHFPQQGIGRIKRSTIKAREYGALYKEYFTYNASRPSGSRFDHNPNLYFMVQAEDRDGDYVIVAGGLYMPSSRQMRAIREAIAEDASAFDELFRSKAFSSRFKGGFSDERKATRPPRGFDPNHPRIEWLKLQGFFVWRSYPIREFTSPKFYDIVTKDFEQILRLNALLEKAIAGRLPAAAVASKPSKKEKLENRIDEVEAPRRKMDF